MFLWWKQYPIYFTLYIMDNISFKSKRSEFSIETLVNFYDYFLPYGKQRFINGNYRKILFLNLTTVFLIIIHEIDLCNGSTILLPKLTVLEPKICSVLLKIQQEILIKSKNPSFYLRKRVSL